MTRDTKGYKCMKTKSLKPVILHRTTPKLTITYFLSLKLNLIFF